MPAIPPLSLPRPTPGAHPRPRAPGRPRPPGRTRAGRAPRDHPGRAAPAAGRNHGRTVPPRRLDYRDYFPDPTVMRGRSLLHRRLDHDRQPEPAAHEQPQPDQLAPPPPLEGARTQTDWKLYNEALVRRRTGLRTRRYRGVGRYVVDRGRSYRAVWPGPPPSLTAPGSAPVPPPIPEGQASGRGSPAVAHGFGSA